MTQKALCYKKISYKQMEPCYGNPIISIYVARNKFSTKFIILSQISYDDLLCNLLNESLVFICGLFNCSSAMLSLLCGRHFYIKPKS